MLTCLTTNHLNLYMSSSVYSQVVDSSQELVCSSNDPTDCYPKVFEPTYDWQPIREGQDIPPGLHVRLNIDTLVKEAKIMEQQEEEMAGDLVSVPETDDAAKDDEETQAKQILEKISEFKAGKAKTRASASDLSSFDDAVSLISEFQPGDDKHRLSQALETLIELSHDIEFGVKISLDPTIFDNFMGIGKDVTLEEVYKEKLYRIMGSTLRNNPEAIRNVLDKQSPIFIDGLFQQLAAPEASDVIKKRILGIIHALSLNKHFAAKYLNSVQSGTKTDDLIKVFPALKEDTKSRLINILEDLDLVSSSDKKNRDVDDDDSDPNLQFSVYLQNRLIDNKVSSTSQFKLLFNSLKEIHENNGSLKVSNGFLDWLSQEIETRKENSKRDTHYSPEDREFDRELVVARHESFGNPMGLRKGLADFDEL